MPFLSPPHDSVKPASRFSSLNVLRLKSGAGPGLLDVAPPPPPKDPSYTSSPNLSLNPPPSAFYNKPFFSRSATSLAPSLSPDTNSGPATPSSPFPPMPSAGFEFGKRSNFVLANANGRGAVSPVPSASGGSFKFLSRGQGEYLPAPSMDGSTDSSGSCPNVGPNLGVYLSNGASSSSYNLGQATTASVKPKKSVFKLANLAKRNRSRKDLSDTASTSESVSRSTSVSEHGSTPENAEGDEGITLPWNFQHHIHVDEGYIGLPPSWSTALSQVGFSEEEIAAIHARRRAAATSFASSTDLANLHTTYSNERPASPRLGAIAPNTSTSASSSATLLEPLPRSTSLGKGRNALATHPTSVYSIATSTTMGPSPSPSPRTPSFSMKSIVSGIKNSLTSDSAHAKDSDGPMRGGGATGEETDQYVLVDGDGPDEARDPGMGDETLIEPYPFDSSSVSSHRAHSPRIRQMSQDQQTPRTPTFPQIQVHRAHSEAGHVAFPSPASRAPSPLSHSVSLPIPTPPRGYTYSDISASPSPSHSSPRLGPLSAPPRSSSRRIYHVVNSSSDSYEGENYAEPPPAYASLNREEWTPRKEKEGSTVLGGPPPNRPIPPLPAEQILGEPSGVGIHDNTMTDQEVPLVENSQYTMGSSFGNIPGTVDEVLDISSHYSDNSVHGGDAEMDPTQPTRVLSPIPPLVIDKRMTKLTTLPPRISFHQEDNLEDWSESLFSAIGGKGNRTSVLMRPQTGDAASIEERRTTIRWMSRLSMAGGSGTVSSITPNSLLTDAAPSLPDVSFGANLTLGSHARPTVDAVEGGEQGQAENKTEETKITPDAGGHGLDTDTPTTTREIERIDRSPVAPSTPLLPDVSLGPNVSSLGKDLELPPAASSPPPESPNKVNIDELPPSPPSKPKPKPKPKPAPLALPGSSALAPPRMNIITGISGKSPVNALFGAKPQPLPIPIPLSQIRTQLRPAPPKSPHPPPTLPLPPLKRIPSQPGFQPPLLPSQLTPVSSPQKGLKPNSTSPQASPSDSLPSSSRTLQPARLNPGDRDSGLSTITVTPATITTAKTEVVRTAVASVVDSDTVSLASRRESAVSTADTESQTLTYGKPDIGVESPHSQEQGEAPDDSLLNDGPQSKWPAPPPPPVEFEADSTPHRVSRFRSTSLGRVSQILAIASPVGHHFSHRGSDAVSNPPSESVPSTTPNGMSGRSPSVAPKTRLAVEARLLSSRTNTFGGVDGESEDNEPRSDPSGTRSSGLRTSIPPDTHPLLSQLEPYITPRNPGACFTNLAEIAEGESGSVFAARVISSFADSRPQGQQESIERPIPPGTSHVAIKRIPLPSPPSVPSLSDDSPVSNKLVSVLHELCLLKNLDHEHLLLPDAVYVGPNSSEAEGGESARAVDTSLWIRMELMERSLADVIGLVAEGLALQERLVGRFASDVLHGLDYLQKQHIAHRDVRSDNLLVNATGVVKLADFSNAIRVDRNAPMVKGAVGVIYWQAPEMRAGPYDALKVDIWSLGATVWELAETVPPFSVTASPSTQMSFATQTVRHVGSQWPPLTHPEHYSRSFHEFLKLCGRESGTRPGPGELLNTQFIRNACGRPVILQLLSQCRAIEEAMADREAPTGQS